MPKEFEKLPQPNVSDQPHFISRQVVEARRFYFGNMDDRAANEVSVVCGGWERTSPDYVINRDSFPWMGLEFVAEGRGLLQISGRQYELRRGVCFVYGPGIPHRIETDPEALLSKYYLNFTGREAADLLSAMMMEPGTCRQSTNSEELEELLQNIITDGNRDRPQAAVIAALQLRVLLLKLSGDGLVESRTDRRARQTLRECLEYMDQNFLEISAVEQVARARQISPSHLTRLFIRFGYGPPHRYLTRRKMLYAATLLDSGVLLVREVADRLRLDPFQFSRTFKRVHGISPSDFVQRHGKA